MFTKNVYAYFVFRFLDVNSLSMVFQEAWDSPLHALVDSALALDGKQPFFKARGWFALA